MKQPIKISIYTPCHEQWEKMESRPCGAFCNSCNKEVIDFTTKTNSEIYDILTASKGNLCGRFYNYQVEQPIVKQEINNSYFNIKAIAASLASLLGLQALGAGKDNAPKPITEVTTPKDTAVIPQAIIKDTVSSPPLQAIEAVKEEIPYEASLPCNYTLTGKVYDNATGLPLPQVRIYTGDMRDVYYTDSNGVFTIEINEKKFGTNNPGLKFDHMSYAYKIYTPAEIKQQQSEICLDPQAQVLDDLVVSANISSRELDIKLGGIGFYFTSEEIAKKRWKDYKENFEYLPLAKRAKIFFRFAKWKIKYAFKPKGKKNKQSIQQ